MMSLNTFRNRIVINKIVESAARAFSEEGIVDAKVY